MPLTVARVPAESFNNTQCMTHATQWQRPSDLSSTYTDGNANTMEKLLPDESWRFRTKVPIPRPQHGFLTMRRPHLDVRLDGVNIVCDRYALSVYIEDFQSGTIAMCDLIPHVTTCSCMCSCAFRTCHNVYLQVDRVEHPNNQDKWMLSDIVINAI